MFGNRLKKNARKLRRWVRREGISCYRVYDRDIPEIPFCVDWYDGNLHVAEYVRRSTEALSPDEHERWRQEVIAAGALALDVDIAKVFVKRRDHQRGKQQYVRVSDDSSIVIVREGGHRFIVNLSDYLDTGLFLDHRSTRQIVGADAAGKDVLNLFGYTGSFTVYAIGGGARTSTTVDMSRTYIDWTRRNLEINGFTKDPDRHKLLREEAQEFLDSRAEAGLRFDLIILDPPTFSNSKRMHEHFDVGRDHPRMILKALKVLAPGGVLYFSTNSRRFRLDREALGKIEVEDITDSTIPLDFRDRKIHRCFKIRSSRRRLL